VRGSARVTTDTVSSLAFNRGAEKHFRSAWCAGLLVLKQLMPIGFHFPVTFNDAQLHPIRLQGLANGYIPNAEIYKQVL
jgi:hypothetical protein